MSSGAAHATASNDHGGRASKPGRRWVALAAAIATVAASVAAVLLITGGGKAVSNSTFGQLPAWLPKIKTPAEPRYEQASVAHPILSEEQGYTVHAHLPTGSADITAVGPAFPAYVTSDVSRGVWPDGKQVPSTFYVTLADVKGTIPISSNAFSVQNQAYQRVGATISLQGEEQLPHQYIPART